MQSSHTNGKERLKAETNMNRKNMIWYFYVELIPMSEFEIFPIEKNWNLSML